MTRFNVTVPEGTMKLYYNSEEECRSVFPDAEISLCNDDLFLSYVDKIKSECSNIVYDYRGREVWVIETNIGKILYRQFFCDDAPIDGCAYQVRGYQLVEPVLFDVSDPKEFYETILEPVISERNAEFITPEDGKKAGLKKYFDKDGYRYFTDSEGRFYVINKIYLPTKKNKETYTKYHGTDAVYVRYGTGIRDKYEWFDDINTFLKFFEQYRSSISAAFGTVRYKVINSGAKLKDLNKCETVLSLGHCPPVRGKDQVRAWAYSLKNAVKDWDQLIDILDNIVNKI